MPSSFLGNSTLGDDLAWVSPAFLTSRLTVSEVKRKNDVHGHLVLNITACFLNGLGYWEYNRTTLNSSTDLQFASDTSLRL